MKDKTLPTYRKGRLRQHMSSSASFAHDGTSINLPVNGGFDQSEDSFKKGKKVFSRHCGLAVVGFVLTIFVSGSLSYTNYSPESVVEFEKEVLHSHEGQIKNQVDNHIQDHIEDHIENQTISIPAKKPRATLDRSNTTKFEWDGSRRKGKKTYLMSDLGFDHLPKPIFKTHSEQNQALFKGMSFGQMLRLGKLAPCRLDQHNSCLPESTSVNRTAKANNHPQMLLYNPLQEGMPDKFFHMERRFRICKQRKSDCALMFFSCFRLQKTDFGVENASRVVTFSL